MRLEWRDMIPLTAIQPWSPVGRLLAAADAKEHVTALNRQEHEHDSTKRVLESIANRWTFRCTWKQSQELCGSVAELLWLVHAVVLTVIF